MKHEELARQKEMYRLAQIATGSGPAAGSAAWASVSDAVGGLAKRATYAIRSAFAGPSEPSEQCC